MAYFLYMPSQCAGSCSATDCRSPSAAKPLCWHPVSQLCGQFCGPHGVIVVPESLKDGDRMIVSLQIQPFAVRICTSPASKTVGAGAILHHAGAAGGGSHIRTRGDHGAGDLPDHGTATGVTVHRFPLDRHDLIPLDGLSTLWAEFPSDRLSAEGTGGKGMAAIRATVTGA